MEVLRFHINFNGDSGRRDCYCGGMGFFEIRDFEQIIDIKNFSLQFPDPSIGLYKMSTYDYSEGFDQNPIHEFWWHETNIDETDLYLYYYAYNGDKEMIDRYMNKDSNENWTDCMKFAEYGNHEDLIEFFINKGADPNQLGQIALKNYIKNFLQKSNFLCDDIINVVMDYY